MPNGAGKNVSNDVLTAPLLLTNSTLGDRRAPRSALITSVVAGGETASFARQFTVVRASDTKFLTRSTNRGSDSSPSPRPQRSTFIT